MKHWLADLCTLLAAGKPAVRVVVATTRGSAPREAGACMLVHADGVVGSIGGGRLEYMAVQRAGTLLRQSGAQVKREEFVLGKELEQCCGGIVELWWERFETDALSLLSTALERLRAGVPVGLVSAAGRRAVLDDKQAVLAGDPALLPDTAQPDARPGTDSLLLRAAAETVLAETLQRQDTPLWLYGAGHVGQAIVAAMQELPFDITWIDSRAGMPPAEPPPAVRVLHRTEPELTVAEAPHDACFLVLTHDHEQDFRIVHAILERRRFAFAGLIGSGPKALRFRQRLGREGLP
ncbi:MAG: xanthine dehydrogenase accessory protein XdhC, partial [Ectothiorhodospiraceae bacterium]|nr:xanthine dehydrogenase accessory protein XdhC [Ectothiorhodospiraceae bacterium]